MTFGTSVRCSEGVVISRDADMAPQGLWSASGSGYFAGHHTPRSRFLVFVSVCSIEGVEATTE